MSQLQDILYDGYTGNLTTPSILQALSQLPDTAAAQYCLISAHTWRRWKTDRTPNRTAIKLLAIRAGYVPWPGWENFFYCAFDGCLYHTDLTYGFDPGDLLTLHWLRQENTALRLALKNTNFSLVTSCIGKTSQFPPQPAAAGRTGALTTQDFGQDPDYNIHYAQYSYMYSCMKGLSLMPLTPINLS